jgi:hypothetical protein
VSCAEGPILEKKGFDDDDSQAAATGRTADWVSGPEDLTRKAGLFSQLKKVLMERALGAELTRYPGYVRAGAAGGGIGNSRNGHSSKTVIDRPGLAPAIGPEPSSHNSCPRGLSGFRVFLCRDARGRRSRQSYSTSCRQGR